MNRKIITILGTVGILGVGYLLITIMGMLRPEIERTTPPKLAPAVFFEVVEPQTVTLQVPSQGEVRPRTDINLTAQVAGRVISISEVFVDGGAFKAGDTLLRIEDADYRAAAAAAKARMAQAEEALKREEAEAELAARDYAELGREGTPSDLTLRKPQLAQARAGYEAAKAEYAAARINLDRTHLRAPFDGRVRQRIAGLGQYVAPGAQLGRIFSTDVAEIRLSLTDEDLARIGLQIAFTEANDQKGPKVVLSTNVAGAFNEWTGRITRIDGAFDPTTRQTAGIAVVEDPYDTGASETGTPLAAGLFVDARIQGVAINDAYVISRAGLQGRDAVYVIGPDNLLEFRQVRVIASDRDSIIINAGLANGERIVVSPLRGAGAGDPVTPTPRNRTQTDGEPAELAASNPQNGATSVGGQD